MAAQSGRVETPNCLIMQHFESSTYNVNAAPAELSAFLSTPSNLKSILPEDRIEDWESSATGCAFKIKGLAHIQLKLGQHSVNEVKYVSAGEKPFPFQLVVHIADKDGASQLQAAFDAEVNTFMSMMLKNPLTNFLNSLGEAIQKKYSGA